MLVLNTTTESWLAITAESHATLLPSQFAWLVMPQSFFPVRPSSLSHPSTSAFMTSECIYAVPAVAYLLQPFSDTCRLISEHPQSLWHIHLPSHSWGGDAQQAPNMHFIFPLHLMQKCWLAISDFFLLQGVLLPLVIPSPVLPLLGLPDPERRHEHIWCWTNAQQRSSNNPA